MAAASLHRVGTGALRLSLRSLRAQTSYSGLHRAASAIAGPRYLQAAVFNTSFKSFHSSPRHWGILPESENPPPESEPSERPTVPTDISTSEYHERADEYLNELVTRLEQAQESRADLEVDYSAGVLEFSIPSNGIYVINKQPPNKQIWLSSPLSGPKRFDWVVSGEGMHEKEGAGVGDWIYLRDGTSLTELLRTEVGINLGVDNDVAQ